jgi:hypothetical protein
MGRTPIGERAMTGTERSRRWRDQLRAGAVRTDSVERLCRLIAHIRDHVDLPDDIAAMVDAELPREFLEKRWARAGGGPVS